LIDTDSKRPVWLLGSTTIVLPAPQPDKRRMTIPSAVHPPALQRDIRRPAVISFSCRQMARKPAPGFLVRKQRE
jgi:hypothetical protein